MEATWNIININSIAASFLRVRTQELLAQGGVDPGQVYALLQGNRQMGNH